MGIATINPQYTLDVAGSCYISSGLIVNEVAYGGLKLEGGPNENAMFIKDGTATNPNQYDGYFVGNSLNYGGPSTFQIGRIDNGTVNTSKALYMTQNGNVGIGTFTPQYKLDVAGSIYASGNITAGSDIRFKTDINTIDHALSTVKNLRGVSYQTIDTQRKNIGVIAQEIEKVLPEVVLTDNTENKFKSVAYGNIVGVLIEAIKELSDKVDSLEKLIHRT
jgi:hypothetical protein